MSLFAVDKAAWQNNKNIGDDNVSVLFIVLMQ